MYKRILVSTDGSALSQCALDHAVHLAKASGAALCIVVVEEPEGSEGGPKGAQFAQSVARDRADAAVEYARERGMRATPFVVEAESVYEGIVRTAVRRKCDLIVMASHGRRGYSALILGSETTKVMTHAPMPVTVVKGPVFASPFAPNNNADAS